METQPFLEREWDYCLVLDACRYDTFADIYPDYLDGTLEKHESPGSSTPEWAYRTFSGDHDIAYFSGNPFINDLGIPLNELKWGASCDYEWTATDHLRTVIDVWKEGWDDELGTVPPENVAASLRRHQDEVASADRTVLHYMQPHAPYLSRGKGGKLTQIRKGIRRQEEAVDGQGDGGGVVAQLGDWVRPKIEQRLEALTIAQKAGLWLELNPIDLLTDGTREAAFALYEENLRIALESIAELVTELDGRVIVTADHGEAFGEQDVWEHHIETYIPSLVEVPWLEVS